MIGVMCACRLVRPTSVADSQPIPTHSNLVCTRSRPKTAIQTSTQLSSSIQPTLTGCVCLDWSDRTHVQAVGLHIPARVGMHRLHAHRMRRP